MEHVNSFVETKYNMSLKEFLRQKVEIECLYNYEIAALLGIEKSAAGKLIRQAGLKRKNGYARRFEQNHGNGSVDLFRNMIERLDTSLSDVARHFGFSREYARQAHRNLFGQPYTETLNSKRDRKKRMNKEAKAASKKSKALAEFKQRLTALGFSLQVLDKRGPFKVVANGYILAFRYSQRPHKISGRWQFRITYLNSESHSDCDFLICLCRLEKESIYYILPKHTIPKHGICFIPEAGESESKYAKYKEAWDMLLLSKSESDEIQSNHVGNIQDGVEDYPYWHSCKDMLWPEKPTCNGGNMFGK